MADDKLQHMIANGEFTVRDLRGTPRTAQEDEEDNDDTQMGGDEEHEENTEEVRSEGPRSRSMHASTTPGQYVRFSSQTLGSSDKKADSRIAQQFQLREILGRFIGTFYDRWFHHPIR